MSFFTHRPLCGYVEHVLFKKKRRRHVCVRICVQVSFVFYYDGIDLQAANNEQNVFINSVMQVLPLHYSHFSYDNASLYHTVSDQSAYSEF